VSVTSQALPSGFSLQPAYPNPFNAGTALRYQVPEVDRVTLRVWNLSGQVVRTLVSQPQVAGSHQAVWDGLDDAGSEASSGVYVVALEAGNQICTRKLVLVR